MRVLQACEEEEIRCMIMKWFKTKIYSTLLKCKWTHFEKS